MDEGADKWEVEEREASSDGKLAKAKVVAGVFRSPTSECLDLSFARAGLPTSPHSHSLQAIHLGRVQEGHVLAPAQRLSPRPLQDPKQQQQNRFMITALVSYKLKTRSTARGAHSYRSLKKGKRKER